MKVFLAILLGFGLAPICSVGQDMLMINIAGDKSTYTPAHFHITEVVDSRTFTGSIGKVSDGPVAVDGGLADGIKAFVAVPMAENSIPVSMHVNQFEVKEKAAGSKRQFELSVTIAYYAGESKLLEYSGNAFAQSVTNAAPYIEKLVKDNITGNLKEFDSWMAKNKQTISAEPTVTVQVAMSGLSEQKTHIAYSKNRKLFITDFEAEPDDASIGAAATLSGIGMKIQASSLRKNTNVNVILTVYFDRARSWMKDNGKNVTTLQHEQLHFDITALKACMLKQQIEKAEFSPANYKQQLRDMLAKVQEETGDMQNMYDLETEHGTIIDKQEDWTRRIEEMKRNQTCYR
ncbi:MAG TPA: hypothetical protein VIN07_10965 [Flavipsychrobacter sp.]